MTRVSLIFLVFFLCNKLRIGSITKTSTNFKTTQDTDRKSWCYLQKLTHIENREESFKKNPFIILHNVSLWLFPLPLNLIVLSVLRLILFLLNLLHFVAEIQNEDLDQYDQYQIVSL